MKPSRLVIAGLASMVLAGCTAATAGSAARPSSPGKPGAGSFEAMVVGTIHKAHLMEPGYPLSTLAALLDGYQPDLVLVEIRPEPFGLGHFEDGPFEMTYVTWLAQKKGIKVVPIDWFRDEDVGREPEPDAGAKEAFERETKALEPRMKWPLTFAEVHSAEQDATLLATLDVQARYLAGNGVWNQRQTWFHHQAGQAIRETGARRVLAFVGAFHRPELEAHLATQGGTIRGPRSVPLPEGERAPVPAPVIQLWREGAERLRAQAASATGKSQEALQAKATYFEVAANHAGQCCLEPSAFRSPPSK